MTEEKELLEKELKDLQEVLKKNIESEKLKKEIAEIRNKLSKTEFRKKHSGLLKVTGALENGVKGFFKGIIKAVKATGKALEKSDAYIAEQKAKEAKSNKQEKPAKEID